MILNCLIFIYIYTNVEVSRPSVAIPDSGDDVELTLMRHLDSGSSSPPEIGQDEIYMNTIVGCSSVAIVINMSLNLKMYLLNIILNMNK